jgi:hypothetical protein
MEKDKITSKEAERVQRAFPEIITDYFITARGRIINFLDHLRKHYSENHFYYFACFLTVILVSEPAYAFNVNAGISAGMNPVIQAVNNHWGKGVALAAIGGFAMAGGDMRTRTFAMGGGALAAGVIFTAIISAYDLSV